MIEMINVGGILILIAQELQCRKLTKKIVAQDRVIADLKSKNQQFAKHISLLESGANRSPLQSVKDEITSKNSNRKDFDLILETVDTNKRKRTSRQMNL
jgi:hypothetical protein